jgi:hypothetical protein
MKKRTKILILLCFLGLTTALQSQLKSKTLNDLKIDTLYLFEPLGDIYFNSKHGDLPSEPLTIAFSEDMKQNISQNLSPTVIQYVPVDDTADSLYARSFYEKLSQFGTMSKKQFEKTTVDEQALNMLQGKPGRYVGVIFINGYSQRHYTEKLIGGIALFAATVILTYGSSYYLYTPKEPFAEATLIIIDRQEKKYLYYCNHKVVKDPLKPGTVKHLSSELISDINN